MRTFSQLLNLYTQLTNNQSGQNQTNGTQLMSEQQRLLLENYFDNERQYTTETIGTQSLTITATPAKGDTSATLSSSWTYASGEQRVQFTGSDNPVCQFTNGSTTITWQQPLTTAATNANITTGGFQRYRLPAGVSKITNETITVGNLRFVPAPVQTRTEWDNVNFLPYNSDIPNYYFIYGGYVEFWPVPSTTGNTVTFNYKTRVPDFNTAFVFSDTSGTAFVSGQTTYDYQKGTISAAAVNSVNITGTSTAWNSTGKFPLNVDITQWNLGFMIQPPYGDGIWYQIQQFTDDTHLILSTPIQNSYNISSATYLIGQMPILQEDFQEMLVYGSVRQYYTAIYPDPNRFNQFDKIFQERQAALDDYAGTKQVNYNLGDRPALLNPNNYPFAPGSVQSP